ncbi:SCO family protein [Marinivivus vitaminiproducens]|uniref:SCO family protein n=1 Tax=Marinivivus vitaminiproducens TaxID=3035935 RepID=UPI0027A06B86|nr:SCO family protein [Geminicoccaceae bacterium SCSIO 64248]
MTGRVLWLSVAIALSASVGIRAEPFDPLAAATLTQQPGARVPSDVAFRDATGGTVQLGDLYRGRPVILAPVYYRCPNICGLTLSGVFDALAGTDLRLGRDVDVVAFSIDPRETPEVAAQAQEDYRARYGDTALKAHFLTSEAAASRTVADALGFGYAYDEAIGQYAHPSAIAVTTGAGVVARYMNSLTPDAASLRLALVESSEGRFGGVIDQVRLLCFTYDPQTGKYSASILRLIQVMGTATVLILAAGLAWFFLRERRLRPPSRTSS